jgi:hypothetical protein
MPLIERRITSGNVATIVVIIITWLISGAIWYTRVSGHITDEAIHPPLDKREALIDARVHLLLNGQISEVNRRLSSIEADTSINTKLLHEIKGQLERR